MSQSGKTAIIVGATGMVGTYILHHLAFDNLYARIVILSRGPLNAVHYKIQHEVVNFDRLDPALVKGHDLYCALGTTRRKAGSKEAQYKMDCTYPYEIAKAAKANGVEKFMLVSSLGADPQSSNFYLRTKGELEEKLKALQFDNLVIARPSILIGKRKEFRLGEKIGIWFSYLIWPFLFGSWRKYRFVHARRVAASLVITASYDLKGMDIIESDRIQTFNLEHYHY